MSYRKEDLLSIAGELGLHCRGMEQEEIAAKVAAEVLKPEVMKASFLVADDQEVLAGRGCSCLRPDQYTGIPDTSQPGKLAEGLPYYGKLSVCICTGKDRI